MGLNKFVRSHALIYLVAMKAIHHLISSRHLTATVIEFQMTYNIQDTVNHRLLWGLRSGGPPEG